MAYVFEVSFPVPSLFFDFFFLSTSCLPLAEPAEPVGLSLFSGISIVFIGDLSLCSGDDILPPMSSNLLVELVVILLAIVGTSAGGTVAAAAVVGVERMAPTVVGGRTISGVLGNKALRPWRSSDDPPEPEPPEFGASVWIFGENLDSEAERSERCLRSHQFCENLIVFICFSSIFKKFCYIPFHRKTRGPLVADVRANDRSPSPCPLLPHRRSCFSAPGLTRGFPQNCRNG